MKIKILAASAAILVLAACGGNEATTADNMAVDNMAMDDMATDNMAMDNMAMNTAMPGVPADGKDYAQKAAGSDMYEIEAARIAADKSDNADVKALAAMIRADHEKATADLKTAAAKAKPAITVTPAMDAEQTANVAALRAASDADFDRVYLAQQVAAHTKALAMVEAYAASGEVASLKEHAGKVAGPIGKHLARARELSNK